MITRTHACWILLAIVLATGVLRFTYLDAFLGHVPEATILKSLTSDTDTYLAIARSLANGCGFLGTDHDTVLNRPPGYPLFALPFHVTDSLPRGIVRAQVLLTLFGPWFVYRAVREAGCGRGAGLAAGAALAFSPTNIAITGFVIPDSVFATIMTLATWLLVRAWRRGTTGAAFPAGIALALGLLMKPAISFWWILAPALLLLARFATRRPVRAPALLALALPPLLLLLGWSARNYVAEGVFQYSTVGMRTIRFYTGVQIEEWNRLGRFPTMEEEQERRHALYDHYGPKVELRMISMQEYRDEIQADTRAILTENPGRTIRAFVRSSRQIAFGRCGYHRRQLPESHDLYALFERLSYLEWKARRLIPPVVFVLLAVGAVIVRRSRQDRSFRDRFVVSVMLLIIYAYFWTACGVTSNTGPRIVHPGEPALLVAVIALFSLIADTTARGRSDSASA